MEERGNKVEERGKAPVSKEEIMKQVIQELAAPPQRTVLDLFVLDEAINRQVLYSTVAALTTPCIYGPPPPAPNCIEDFLWTDDIKFNDTFHIQRQSVHKIVEHLGPRVKNFPGFSNRTFLLFLYYLAAHEHPQSRLDPLVEVAKLGGISIEETKKIIIKTAEAMGMLADKSPWPDHKEIEELHQGFLDKYAMPVTFGALDVILYTVPDSGYIYIQFFLDYKNRIRHLYFAYVEGMSRMLPPLPKLFESSNLSWDPTVVPKGRFILVDQKFPNIGCLIPPFPNPKDKSEIRFNEKHSRAMTDLYEFTKSCEDRFPRLCKLQSHFSLADNKSIIGAAYLLNSYCRDTMDLAPY